jgi:hypothetical protein
VVVLMVLVLSLLVRLVLCLDLLSAQHHEFLSPTGSAFACMGLTYFPGVV